MSLEIAEMAHSRYGASSSHRWFACPASIPLSKDVKKKSSEAADHGTAAHTLAETCLREKCNTIKYLGTMIGKFEVDDVMADAVQLYLNTVREYCVGVFELNIEQKFTLDWIEPEAFGTNDASVIQVMEKIVILDLKFGAGVPVEAFGNEQLLYYALGAARNHPGLDVECVIVQPRCFHPDGPVRRWHVTYDQLMEFEKKLIAKIADVKAAENSRDVYAYASAGDHCKFCPAAGFCKALRNEAVSAASLGFDDVVLSDPPTAKEMSPDQISRALQLSSVIEEWLKSVNQYAFEQLSLGKEIPGYKLVKRDAHRKWKDEKVVEQEFEGWIGDKLWSKKLISPSQLETLLGKKNVSSELWIKPDGGFTIAPVSDKRPAVIPTAIDFENVNVDAL